MDKGASPSALNTASRTPVDEALTRGYDAVMEVIRSFDKNPEGAGDSAVDAVDEDGDDMEDTPEEVAAEEAARLEANKMETSETAEEEVAKMDAQEMETNETAQEQGSKEGEVDK
eukprot:gene16355-22556_t